MPILGNKAIESGAKASIRGALATDGAAWGGDEYRPSQRGAVSGHVGSLLFGDAIAQGRHRMLCGNEGCASGWMMPWRNRRRPIFEGQWGCSGRCVLAMAQAAVERELGDGNERTVVTPHRHRVPLGLLMLGQGWITHPQLRRALDAQRESGTGRIGDWLQSECGVEPEQVTRALSMQWSCPVLNTEGFSPETMALVAPKLIVQEFGLLPLRVAGARILYLGFEDRLDASAAFAFEKMLDLKVESGLVEGGQFRGARARLLDCECIETRLETVANKDAMAARMTAILEQRKPLASRMVRIHQYYWMRMWLESGAAGRAGTLPGTREDVSDHVFSIGG